MDNQPKYRAQAASQFFYDGATMRLPIEGTVARGELHEDTAFYAGVDEAGLPVAAMPIAVDEALLLRGQERYDIYCAPCHHPRGNGKGVLWDRAQIESADLMEQRLKDAPDGELFNVITNGLGLMSGYKYPIPPHDRWAIIAYIRRLQNEAGS
ncbi:MAG: cytochrome c [Acidobacteriota bacterium]